MKTIRLMLLLTSLFMAVLVSAAPAAKPAKPTTKPSGATVRQVKKNPDKPAAAAQPATARPAQPHQAAPAPQKPAARPGAAGRSPGSLFGIRMPAVSGRSGAVPAPKLPPSNTNRPSQRQGFVPPPASQPAPTWQPRQGDRGGNDRQPEHGYLPPAPTTHPQGQTWTRDNGRDRNDGRGQTWTRDDGRDRNDGRDQTWTRDDDGRDRHDGRDQTWTRDDDGRDRHDGRDQTWTRDDDRDRRDDRDRTWTRTDRDFRYRRDPRYAPYNLQTDWHKPYCGRYVNHWRYVPLLVTAIVRAFGPSDPRVLGDAIIGSDDTFLGIITRDCEGEESVTNGWGRFGSPLSPFSIWNPEGRWGSQYSPDSPWNPYAVRPPKLFDGDDFRGYLTTNPNLYPRVDPEWLRSYLELPRW